MDEQISKKAALVAVKDALMAWSYMPEWRDEKILEAIAELPSALGTNLAEVDTDCISRQAVKELAHNQIREKYCGIAFKEERDFYIKLADSIIDLLPYTQPEIIRCKDCKYAEYIDDVQTLWCTECGQGRTVAPDDFCSYAERREETE